MRLVIGVCCEFSDEVPLCSKHKKANEARKLTKEQKMEKAQKKLASDGTSGVRVAVFRCVFTMLILLMLSATAE